MAKFRIYRHPEGISLNGKEFICGDDGEVKLIMLKSFGKNME